MISGEGILNAGAAVDYSADDGNKLKLANYFHQQNQERGGR